MAPLPLALHLALGGLRPAPPLAPEARPGGALVWMHAESPGRAPALGALARALAEEEGAATLLTLPEGTALPALPGVTVRHAPPEAPAAIRAFLAQWRPDLLLWAGGGLRPALLALARMPRLLVEGAPEGRMLSRGAWIPGLSRAVVPLFDRAVVADAEAAQRLRRAGLPEARLQVSPPLGEPPTILPCNERERRDLAATLAARPVWLAADLPLAELGPVIAAQRLASRSAHRLLLIVAPREASEAGAMARALGEAGLKVASRAEGAEPDEASQAYLVEAGAEMGLWMRLAPLAYLGGTLPGGPGGRDPFEAAALGSALLHGPVTAPWGSRWRRLGAAGAARLVRAGGEVGPAVEQLLAPDRVSAMALGAWDVATQGAEAVARAARMVAEALDAREAA